MSLEFKSTVEISVLLHTTNEKGETKELCDTMGMPHEIIVKKVSEPHGREETLTITAVNSHVEFSIAHKDITYWIKKVTNGNEVLVAVFDYPLDKEHITTPDSADKNRVLGDAILNKAFEALIKPFTQTPFHINKANIAVAQWMVDTGVIWVSKEIKVNGSSDNCYPGHRAINNQFNTMVNSSQRDTEVERLYKVDKGTLTVAHTIVKHNVGQFTRQTTKLPGNMHDETPVNTNLFAGNVYGGNGFVLNGNGITHFGGSGLECGSGLDSWTSPQGNMGGVIPNGPLTAMTTNGPMPQSMMNQNQIMQSGGFNFGQPQYISGKPPVVYGHQVTKVGQPPAIAQQPHTPGSNVQQPVGGVNSWTPTDDTISAIMSRGIQAYKDQMLALERKWIPILEEAINSKLQNNTVTYSFLDDLEDVMGEDELIEAILKQEDHEMSDRMRCDLILVHLRSGAFTRNAVHRAETIMLQSAQAMMGSPAVGGCSAGKI